MHLRVPCKYLHVPGVLGGQRRDADSLENEDGHIGARHGTRVLCKQSEVFLTTEPFLQSIC